MSFIFEAYIFLRLLIVPAIYSNILSIAFAFLSLLFMLFSFFRGNITVRNNKITYSFLCLTAVYVFILFFSRYSIIYTSEIYSCALICFIYFAYFRYYGISLLFRNLAFASITIQVALYIFFENRDLQTNNFTLISTGSKGISVFVIFILMCIEMRRRRFILSFIYLLYMVFTSFGKDETNIGNRSSLVLAIVFCVVVFQDYVRGRYKNSWITTHSGSFFILSTVLIFIISYGWISITDLIGIEGYHSSIFDTSNNIRVVSNIYVLEQLKTTPELIFYGYDRDIYTQMDLGVGVDSGYLYYNGVRIVQAHHSILDLYQRCGLLFVISYFYFLKDLFNSSKITDRNRVLLPVFVISMIMHSYLQTECLLLLAMVLYDFHKTAYAKNFRIVKKANNYDLSFLPNQ